MTWLTWLMLAVAAAVAAALTGLQPRGTRPVAGTHLMGMARVVLVVFVVICACLAFRARMAG